MSDPGVSVVMATFNGERFLEEQLASILAQLRSEDELIVVDDASTDRTLSILHAWKGPQVQIVANPINVGVRKAFELGLHVARHPIVFLSDQDDVWVEGKRAAFSAAFAAHQGVAAVVSDAEVIDASGTTLAPSFMTSRGGFHGGFLPNLVSSRFLGCAMAVHRSVLERALPIPPQVPMHDMWLGVIASLTGRVSFLEKCYVRYRRHDGNLSPGRPSAAARMIWWRLMLIAAVTGRMTSHVWARRLVRGARAR
jgi:glycosyltransferase involved in cell wall biosynthesis